MVKVDPRWIEAGPRPMLIGGRWRTSEGGKSFKVVGLAKLQLETTRLTKYQPDALPVQPFENDVPLEAKVSLNLPEVATVLRPGQKLKLP